MSKVVCSFVKTCGVPITPVSKDQKGKPIEASCACSHALPHIADWTCLNGICMRVSPNKTSCVPVEG